MIGKTESEIMKKWKESSTPYVSIALFAYNHENYIAEALDSFLMQVTDFPFEVVFHDDASTDDTSKILQEYMKKYPNIIRGILRKENQHSQGKSIVLMLLNEVSSKFIAFCDGDDYWIDSDKLQVQIDMMEMHPDCYMSFHAAEARINDNDHGKIIARYAESNKIFSTSEVISGGGELCPTASIIIRKEAASLIVESEMLELAPTGDYFIQIFASLHGGALYIDKVMSVYRQEVTGSWSSSMKNLEQKKIFYEKMILFLEQLNQYLNKNFQKEIEKKISLHHYAMALEYFENDMYIEFQKTIEHSFNLSKMTSIKYKLFYSLRYFPSLLKIIKLIYKLMTDRKQSSSKL